MKVVLIVVFALIALASLVEAECSASNPCRTGCCSRYGYCGETSMHCLRTNGCVQGCTDGGDEACTSIGGTCQDYATCYSPNRYVSGKCSGSYRNKCCLPGSTSSNTQFLTTAGSYTVENLDRTSRRTFYDHTSPVNKFLLHTIEGAWPSNGDWEGGIRSLDVGNWPHFIVARDRSGRLRIGQFIPLNKRGRAMRANNGAGVIQVEVGAKAAQPFTSHDQEISNAVRDLYAAVRRALPGIPAQSSVRWCGDNNCACSGAYGTSASQRLSTSSFIAYRGLIGHQHSPGDTHWDPGCIDPSRLF